MRKAARAQNLHEARIVVPPVPAVDPRAAEWQALMQHRMSPIIFLIRFILTPILKVVSWILVPLIRLYLYFRIHRMLDVPSWRGAFGNRAEGGPTGGPSSCEPPSPLPDHSAR